MADKEKVIKGLECCKAIHIYLCSGCPYHDDDVDDNNCQESLCADALELLKAQRETIDELISADKALKLKEQESKPLRCKECSYHRNDGWCNEHRREVKESDYCSFGAWEGW